MRGQLSQTYTPAPPPVLTGAVEDSSAAAGVPKAGESTSLGKGRGVLGGGAAAGGPRSQIRRPGVVAGVDARGGCSDQSFWVHPTVADAAIHAGAALRGNDQTGMMVSVSIGHYGPQAAMHGTLASLNSKTCTLIFLQLLCQLIYRCDAWLPHAWCCLYAICDCAARMHQKFMCCR